MMEINKNVRIMGILILTIFFPITFAGMFLYMVVTTCASFYDELMGVKWWQK